MQIARRADTRASLLLVVGDHRERDPILECCAGGRGAGAASRRGDAAASRCKTGLRNLCGIQITCVHVAAQIGHRSYPRQMGRSARAARARRHRDRQRQRRHGYAGLGAAGCRTRVQ